VWRIRYVRCFYELDAQLSIHHSNYYYERTGRDASRRPEAYKILDKILIVIKDLYKCSDDLLTALEPIDKE